MIRVQIFLAQKLADICRSGHCDRHSLISPPALAVPSRWTPRAQGWTVWDASREPAGEPPDRGRTGSRPSRGRVAETERPGNFSERSQKAQLVAVTAAGAGGRGPLAQPNGAHLSEPRNRHEGRGLGAYRAANPADRRGDGPSDRILSAPPSSLCCVTVFRATSASSPGQRARSRHDECSVIKSDNICR